jgi:hypothetical protein
VNLRVERAKARMSAHLARCGAIHREIQAWTAPETWEPVETALETAAARVAELEPKVKT